MKKVILVLVWAYLVTAYAGFKDLTIHSRANCVNNESITWHAGHSYNLMTISKQVYSEKGKVRKKKEVIANWDYTWRSAAVSWNEGYGGWEVWGYHYIKIGKDIQILGATHVTDCSIYDGWWD